MNINYTYAYKNGVITIIVEDDLITTYQVFVDDEFICGAELGNDKYPDGLPNTKAYVDMVKAYAKKDIDSYIEKLVASL